MVINCQVIFFGIKGFAGLQTHLGEDVRGLEV